MWGLFCREPYYSREAALEAAKPGEVLWVERYPARGRYVNQWRLACGCQDLGPFWIRWEVIDWTELEARG